jgi:hypothetical protein
MEVAIYISPESHQAFSCYCLVLWDSIELADDLKDASIDQVIG